MRIFATAEFVLPLPPDHRFPMRKYALLNERVVAAELVPSDQISVPPPATDEEILRVHAPDYLRRLDQNELTAKELRRIGFPWSPELGARERRVAGATIAAARAALDDGCAVNLAGGTHHAAYDYGAGYCVFNDSVIAARALQAEQLIQRVLVIDLDVHQGDGTALLCAHDASIYTFSMHGAKNYPFQKQQSDRDVALLDQTSDDHYLPTLDQALRESLAAAQPDLAIYLAGADPFADDLLGRLALTKDGLRERDRMVLNACRALRLPVAISMAGGYARRIDDTVDIHFATVELAATMFDKP